MFRQIDCHLQGVYIRELQVVSASNYTIYGLKTDFFSNGATAPRGPGPPHCQGFTIILTHQTPLDE